MSTSGSGSGRRDIRERNTVHKRIHPPKLLSLERQGCIRRWYHGSRRNQATSDASLSIAARHVMLFMLRHLMVDRMTGNDLSLGHGGRVRDV